MAAFTARALAAGHGRRGAGGCDYSFIFDYQKAFRTA